MRTEANVETVEQYRPTPEDWRAAIAWVEHIHNVFGMVNNQIAQTLKTKPLLDRINSGCRDQELWTEIVEYATFMKKRHNSDDNGRCIK